MSRLDLGIDLGTANIIIMTGGRAVLNEPTVIAFNRNTEEVVAFGNDAYKMIGRNPPHIAVIKPLKDGVISNNDMAQELIRLCILKVIGHRLINPRIVMCVPSGITTVERKAVVESAVSAGARTVYLIEEPVAALLGAGADILKPYGQMVVDIGGGTTDIAVTSLGGVVASASVKCAGNTLDKSIAKYLADKYRLLIGEKAAEELKKSTANIFWSSDEPTATVTGRSLITGLPASIKLSELDLTMAIQENIDTIVSAIMSVFEKTPPELAGDIIESGIILTGGGAMIRGLDLYITRETGVKCHIADAPLGCVARGTYRVFSIQDKLRNGFEKVSVF
ncbi:MAG: rod shape-determining protein [Oscillospiraceae bacterium]|nr:rod shape-determining protein [Oscillospiraceae bacterium]